MRSFFCSLEAPLLRQVGSRDEYAWFVAATVRLAAILGAPGLGGWAVSCASRNAEGER